MAGCSFCGGMHAPLYICPERQAVMDRLMARGVANKPVVVGPLVANNLPAERPSRHGKYADADKRRAYMRDLMRKRRAGAKHD